MCEPNKRQRFFIFYSLTLGSIVLLYKYFNPLEHALLPKCPIKMITGLDCPGCGGQRAAHHLLNGELQLSFTQNPLLFIFTPYLLLGFYIQLIPQPTTKELQLKRIFYSQKAMTILGIISLLYAASRNIL